MDARLATPRDAAGQTIGTRFTEEQRQCRAVPVAFEAASTTVATATPRALVRLEGAVYLVWTRWAGLDLAISTSVRTELDIGTTPLHFTVKPEKADCVEDGAAHDNARS
jgi:hypothetical protein